MNILHRIFIARRAGDGMVHIAALQDPAARIQLLQAYGVEIDAHVQTRPSAHARSIALALKRRFSLAAMDRDWPWYVVEYHRALAALGEYDLESGDRMRAADLKVAAAVYVDGMGEGVVTGFAECGRVEVSIARFPRGVLTTYAPQAMVHPL